MKNILITDIDSASRAVDNFVAACDAVATAIAESLKLIAAIRSNSVA